MGRQSDATLYAVDEQVNDFLEPCKEFPFFETVKQIANCRNARTELTAHHATRFHIESLCSKPYVKECIFRAGVPRIKAIHYLHIYIYIYIHIYMW